MTTKWQYCAINDNLDTKVKKLKFFYADGNHKGSKVDDIHKEIAKLGNKGWELVSLHQINQPNARVYYFKKSM